MMMMTVVNYKDYCASTWVEYTTKESDTVFRENFEPLSHISPSPLIISPNFSRL
jgi:hypothetical protein